MRSLVQLVPLIIDAWPCPEYYINLNIPVPRRPILTNPHQSVLKASAQINKGFHYVSNCVFLYYLVNVVMIAEKINPKSNFVLNCFCFGAIMYRKSSKYIPGYLLQNRCRAWGKIGDWGIIGDGVSFLLVIFSIIFQCYF